LKLSNNFLPLPIETSALNNSKSDLFTVVSDSVTGVSYAISNSRPSESGYYLIRSELNKLFGVKNAAAIEVRFEESFSAHDNELFDPQDLLLKFRAEAESVKPQAFKILSQDEVSSYQVMQFLEKCKNLGYQNNVSLKSIGYEDKNPPYFWFAIKHSQIVAMAGIHRIEIQGKFYTRGFHRSCILPQYCGPGTGGLSRRLENSVLFSHFLKPQLGWMAERGYEGLYISTNNEFNTSIPKNSGLARSHKILTNLFSEGYALRVEPNVLFRGVYQTLWRLTLTSFNSSRIECGHSRLF